MTVLSLRSRIVAIAVVSVVGSAGVARIAPNDYRGHRSSLRARVMMTDGTARTITLHGVGCTASMCSRVAVRDMKAVSMWLDGVASVRDISHDADGPVSAVFRFRDGAERQASIVPDNRVLYVHGRFGLTEKLDLSRLTRIDFLE